MSVKNEIDRITNTVTTQTAQINALIEQANSLPAAGSGGDGEEEWELVQTVPVSADVTDYVLGDLTTYRKLRFVTDVKLWNTKTGNTWIGVYGENNAVIKRCLLPGTQTYVMQRYEVEWDGGFIQIVGFAGNNLQTANGMQILMHYAGAISGTPKAIISMAAETAASAIDGATFDVYGVRR